MTMSPPLSDAKAFRFLWGRALFGFALILGVSCLAGTAHAVEAAPGFNTSGDTLPLGAGGHEYMYITPTGKVGLGEGNSSPATTLDLTGGLKIGNDTTTCSTTLAGTLSYGKDHPSDASGNLYLCNGVAWKKIGGGSYYGIQNLTMQPYGALVQSSILQFNGPTPETVTVTGPGSPRFRINGGGWVSSATISKGQTIQLQAYAPFADAASETIVFMTGSEEIDWSISTANATYVYASYWGSGPNNCTSGIGNSCSNMSSCGSNMIYCRVGTSCSKGLYTPNPGECNCNDNYSWSVTTYANSGSYSVGMYNRCGQGGSTGSLSICSYGTGAMCGTEGMLLF